jgi:hypothetical protein
MTGLARSFSKEPDVTTPAPLAAALLAALLTSAAAQAQVVPEPDVAEVAKTPLRDLGIDARDIPEVLQQAARDPYSIAGLQTCNALVSEIARLDMVLGADYDIAEDTSEKRLSEGRIGQSIVGSIIPFRGIVREATGAARADRTLRAAYTAGMARRAFLKGLGLGRGCTYPARPKPAAEQ